MVTAVDHETLRGWLMKAGTVAAATQTASGIAVGASGGRTLAS